MFTIYTKDGCPQCDNAKQLLVNKRQSFQAMKIGSDITLESFRSLYPTVKALPFIVSDKPVGGIHELSKLLADK